MCVELGVEGTPSVSLSNEQICLHNLIISQEIVGLADQEIFNSQKFVLSISVTPDLSI